MNETNEHNPDGLTPEQYGAPEWRLLRKGEHVSTTWGDEVWLHGTWDKSQWTGHVVGSDNATYRRRVSPTLAIADQSARIAELERRVEELTEENASLHRQWPEFGYNVEWRDGRHWVYPANGGDFRWNGDPVFNAIHCARFHEQLSQLRAEVERLTKERDEARAWQAEIRDAIHRSGMGIMRTSQGPSGTTLGYRPEVEEEHERKTLEVIHENVDLAAEVRTLKTQLAEREEDRWQPIETAPKDGTHFLAGWFVDEPPAADRFTATVAFYSQIMGNHLLSSPGKYQIGSQVSYWQPIKPPAIRAARAQPEEKP